MKPTEDISQQEALQTESQEIKKAEQIKVEELKNLIKRSEIDVGQLFRRTTDDTDKIVNEVKMTLSEKVGRPVNGTDANNFRNLWSNWEEFKKFRAEFEKYVRNDIYKTKATDERVKIFFRGSHNPTFERMYMTYMNLLTGKNDVPLFKNKTPVPRHKELTNLVAAASEISQKAQDILKLRSRIAETNKKLTSLEKLKEEKENQKTAERIAKEQDEIRNAVKTSVEKKNRFEDRHMQMITSMIGKPEEIEKEFRTCFTLEVLKTETFDVILELLKTNRDKILRTPEYLPDLDDSTNPKADLMKVWEQDLETYKKYQEALEVRKKMKELEDKILGKDELKDERRVDYDKSPSAGKFMEKIMIIVLAEYWKNNPRVKVIPVNDTIDYNGGIDVILEIDSKTDGTKSLLGIDFTMNPEKENQSELSRRIMLTRESAQKLLSKEILKQQPEILAGYFSVPRIIKLNDAHIDFTAIIAEKLYKTIKSSNGVYPEKMVSKIYEETMKVLQKQEGKKPLSIVGLCQVPVKGKIIAA